MSEAFVPRLDAEQLRPLYRSSSPRSAGYVFAVLAGIGLVAGIAMRHPSLPGYALAIVLIGALQHHLSIITHEANHFLLFRWRALNEVVRALSAYATGFRLDYREQHAVHHRRLGEPDDPDLGNYRRHPLSPGAFGLDLLWHASGLAALGQFLQQSGAKGATQAPVWKRVLRDPELLAMLATQCAIAALFFAASGRLVDYLLLWVLPLVTVTKSLTHFRNVAEHTCSGEVLLPRHRTIRCGPLEAFFFAPMNFNYHAEHHFYPGIPFHALPEAHRLMSEQPGYRDAVSVERGYLRFLLTKAIRWRAGSVG